MVLSSCNCYKNMLRKVDQVKVTCTPTVLALKGNAVPADIKVEFPKKYFNKVAVLKITPVLVFEGGEIAGTPKFVQGEKVKDNYTVISKKEGGSYTQSVSFPYDPRADISTLELRIESKCTKRTCKKRKEFLPFKTIPIAQGISTVQKMAYNFQYFAIMKDNYQRVTTVTKEAQIMYDINRSNVKSAELSKDQIKMFEQFVKDYSKKERATLGSVYAKGYASPDGPQKFNDELSKDRSQTGKTAISGKLKDVKGAKYDIASYGEDWDGFKDLVSASNIKDKDLILQVLAMYDSPAKRDEEIHNMSSVFDVLAKDVLPQLRRTKLVASADIQGHTDAELLDIVGKGDAAQLNSLTVEEMLYAATLVKDENAKMAIYKAAADKYNDARAWNNLGVCLAKAGKTSDAMTAFNKAASLSKAPEISNNLGVMALASGDTAKAKSYFSSLNIPEAKANMGLVNLTEGNYTEASKTLTGYNLAVSELCNGNLDKAKAALAKEDCANADYLRGVIAMRQGDSKGAIANLKSAIAKKPELKAKASKDIEFAKLFGTPEFLAL